MLEHRQQREAQRAEHRRAREACDPYTLTRREAQGESHLPPSLEDFGITLPPGVKFYSGPGAVERGTNLLKTDDKHCYV